MSASFVQRIRDDSDEVKYFGIEPQITARAVRLQLRTKDGKIKSYSYSYISDIDYDPEIGIVIYASDSTIIIKGRGLIEIFNYLMSDRVNYIQEDYSGRNIEDSGLFVESIEIKPKFPESPTP